MKHNKIIAFLMAGALLTGLVSCKTSDSNEGNTTEPNTKITTAAPTEEDTTPVKPENPLKEFEHTVSFAKGNHKGVRLLGLREATDDGFLCVDWSCAGVEFTYDSKGGDLTFRVSTNENCAFRVFVDGAPKNNSDGSPYFMNNGTRNMVIPDMPTGMHTVRVIKTSDAVTTTALFFSMTYYGDLQEEHENLNDRDLYIEFVGDAISAGFGTVSGTVDHDGSLAFPYLVANKLDADYSVTALNGLGVVLGTNNAEKVYGLASIQRDGSMDYGFQRPADIVVINLGSVDFAGKDEKGLTGEAFQEAYINLIRAIYRKNGEKCKIYCLYNTVNDNFENEILKACELLGGEDAGLFTLKTDRAAGALPTAEEQNTIAEKLTALLNETKNREVTKKIGLPDGYLDNQGTGDGSSIDYNDPKWN